MADDEPYEVSHLIERNNREIRVDPDEQFLCLIRRGGKNIAFVPGQTGPLAYTAAVQLVERLNRP